MKILILGAGAMGSLFAGKMKQTDADVTLFNRRNSHTDKMKEEGLQIVGKEGATATVFVPVVNDPKDLADHYDLVIVFVKTFATELVLQQILHVINKDTLVLSLQNGLGNKEMLEKWVSRSPVSVGGTECGAGVIEAGVVAHRAFGRTYLGVSDEQSTEKLHKLALLLTKSGLHTDVSHNIQTVIWSKLMINIAYNGLTALTRLKNGDVARASEGQELIRKLLHEANMIAAAEGVTLLYENLEEEAIKIGIEAISNNKSSMLTDIVNQRKTEIDQINGAIVDLGKKFEISTPYNEMVTQLIKMIESNYMKIVTSI